MHLGTGVFIQKFIQSPLQVGSLFPSSKTLAKKMTSIVNWNNIREVAELGAGTGVITKEIVNSMAADTSLYIFEKDIEMREGLQLEFPQCFVHEDASRMTDNIQEGTLDAVFSGLPFANFNQTVRKQIVEEAYRALRPGGVMVAFQYSTQMKSTFQSYFKEIEISFVPKNFPPAFVYLCEK
ncbi:methyltransferase domain-containing protein [Bacillus sp. NEB1478]|uniref:class I SAM-dependent methyltransferase n=1 Tax=Bacillus sp. NEB1478 TaxID=3073816 RepID=UPI002873ACC3|nr:methyltransferase domain-containing protein [Bacillus sp. NEB1478]WNB90826.1 methyltransferase domain-containing protein [Bacillus sp. NEB1478]